MLAPGTSSIVRLLIESKVIWLWLCELPSSWLGLAFLRWLRAEMGP